MIRVEAGDLFPGFFLLQGAESEAEDLQVPEAAGIGKVTMEEAVEKAGADNRIRGAVQKTICDYFAVTACSGCASSDARVRLMRLTANEAVVIVMLSTSKFAT